MLYIYGSEVVGKLWKANAIWLREKLFNLCSRKIGFDIYLNRGNRRVSVMDQLELGFSANGKLSNICYMFCWCGWQNERPILSCRVLIEIALLGYIAHKLFPYIPRNECRGHIKARMVNPDDM